MGLYPEMTNTPLRSLSLLYRAYPGSEFVVVNTLAKWKKSESNVIDFSQGFSQKIVSRSCSAFNSLPASGNFCHLLITFANSLDPDQARQNVEPDLDPNCLDPDGIEKDPAFKE